MPTHTSIFINLTTGLEQLHEFQGFFPDAEFHFTRLQSTHLEHSNYKEFLWSVDNNLLMYLAIDYPITFLDCGSRHADGVPRTIYQGLPFLKYVCNRIWFGEDDPKYCKVKECNTHTYFQQVYNKLFKNSDTKDESLYRKFKYFRKFAKPRSNFRLIGVSSISKYDGKDDEYISIVEEHLYL